MRQCTASPRSSVDDRVLVAVVVFVFAVGGLPAQRAEPTAEDVGYSTLSKKQSWCGLEGYDA